MIIKSPNTKSYAFVTFMESVKMRDKWIEATDKGMSIEEMRKMGINPIGIKE